MDIADVRSSPTSIAKVVARRAKAEGAVHLRATPSTRFRRQLRAVATRLKDDPDLRIDIAETDDGQTIMQVTSIADGACTCGEVGMLMISHMAGPRPPWSPNP